MPLDDRLRDAFQTDNEPKGTIMDSLNAVHATARQNRLRARALGAGAVAAAAAAILVFVTLGGSQPRADFIDQPQPSPPASTSADSVEELHEWWRTRKLTADDLRQTLESAGMSQWSDGVIDDLPAGRWTLTLSIQGTGIWTLTANKGDTDTVIDREAVTADGRRLVISPEFAEGNSTYDYTISTNKSGKRLLSLVFVETTEGVSNGAPGEAHQRALYTTAPFKEFEK